MSRRERLREARPHATSHTGLWLDRFVAGLGEKAAAARHLESALEALRVAEEYPDFFQRFTAALARLPPRTLLADASASGRLVAGLGADSVLETSIALHRTWGVPYLPGSALKGLAARAARQRLDPPWEPSSEPYQILFGELESAGHVTFHDALWCPFEKKTGAPKTALPLDLDVMTVHHAAYYAGEQVPPTDWDDPNPVPFLTTRDTFRLALTGPPGWVELAFKILQGALEQDGLGAKTAAGYGRMRVAELGEMSVAEAVPRPV